MMVILRHRALLHFVHPCRKLKSLDVGGNDAGPDAAAALADALLSHPSLTLLELGYNPLGPGGAAAVAGEGQLGGVVGGLSVWGG